MLAAAACLPQQDHEKDDGETVPPTSGFEGRAEDESQNLEDLAAEFFVRCVFISHASSKNEILKTRQTKIREGFRHRKTGHCECLPS